MSDPIAANALPSSALPAKRELALRRGDDVMLDSRSFGLLLLYGLSSVTLPVVPS